MARIVESTERNEPKIVLSAVKGVTDELIRQANLAIQGSFDISGIRTLHLELVGVLPPIIQAETASDVCRLLDELDDKMAQAAKQGVLTSIAFDDLVVYGEKLAIAIASGYLTELSLHAKPLSGGDAGLMTDGVFGNASILEASHATVRERLGPVHLPLVAGFYGTDKFGRSTTLGRGASDYVATFIAAALGCGVVLFKDVDGVMTADPKIVPGSKLIPRLDYQTALEMARYGSKVLFEKAVLEASSTRTPIEVRSFENLNPGTTVGDEGDGEAISCTKSLSLVSAPHLSSFRTAGVMLSRLDETFGWDSPYFASMFRNGFVVAAGDSQAEEVTKMEASAGERSVEVQRGISIVALIGRRFKISQVVETMLGAGIEPLGVFKTPSGLSTCVLIGSASTESSVRVLHRLLES